MKRIGFILAATILTSCSQIATVKQTTPRLAVIGTKERQLAPAERQLSDAQEVQRSDPSRALGGYLESAEQALDRLLRDPSDKQALGLYNFSVARSIQVIESAQLNPWDRAITVPSPKGSYSLTTLRPRGPDRDPGAYKIIPADSLVVSGSYFGRRTTIDGLGAPLVVVGREKKDGFRKVFAAPRLYAAATAIIRFHKRRAQIEFIEPFEKETVTVQRRVFPVAADFTAPLAVALVYERPDKLGLIRLLRPEKYADTARLIRLQPYDPDRIPVIFVHGLQDTPASWAPMINDLRADREIRRDYQFWVYSYPSGYPYPYSAALFRRELDALAQAYPKHKRIVLVAHSMGGMISRLMLTDADDSLWRLYFGKRPADTALHGESRAVLKESLIFHHRPDIARVIFMSTPHRGADLATNWIGRIASSLVRPPHLLASIGSTVLAVVTVDTSALQMKRMPNSIDTLAPNNRFVRAVDKIPITSGIPYHSIIGDRGRGDTPNSSDGVVAYWSSHLDGAVSEEVGPCNHSSPKNPAAIAEVDRILKFNLRQE